jgi:hypothetical protein
VILLIFRSLSCRGVRVFVGQDPVLLNLLQIKLLGVESHALNMPQENGPADRLGEPFSGVPVY